MSPKSKSFLILLVVLVALVMLYFIWQNPLTRKSAQTTTQEIYSSNLEDVQKIEITNAGQTTVLEKSGEEWVISSASNAVANKILIDNLLTALKEVKTGKIVSQNQEKFASFELTEELSTKLKISDSQGGVLLEILVGKLGPSYGQAYVKKIDSNNVLLVTQNLTSLVNQNSWLKPPDKEPDTNVTPIK